MKYIFLFLFICASIVLQAKDGDALSDPKDSIKLRYTIKEVVVESFKKNDQLNIAPVSASLITSDIIKNRDINNVKDITSLVPNLFIPDYGSKINTPIFIRGIGSRTSDSPAVGLYVDGTPYFDRSTYDFNMNDVERIEVLRGPQGTMYGRNTMGGIINIYTKSPFEYKGSNLSLSAGNYDSYRADASHYGKVGESFGYAISGNYKHFGGFFKNGYTGKKADFMDAASGRIRLVWKVAPRLTAQLSSVYEYMDQDGYPYGLYNVQTGDVGNVNYDGKSFFKRNLSTTGLSLNYVANAFKISSQTSYQTFDSRQRIDQDFTPKSIYGVELNPRQNMFSQEILAQSITKGNYKWQVGVFGFYQDYSIDSQVDYLQSKNVLKRDVENPAKGIAIYHQSVYDNLLTKGLSLTFGLRYDNETIKMDAIKKMYVAATGKSAIDTTNLKNNYSQLTPKIALQYMFGNSNIVYSSVSRGYRSGGFNVIAIKDENKIYKPEFSWSYEVGAKINVIENILRTEVSLFHINWQDQQISQLIVGEGNVIRNAGQTYSNGVELSALLSPAKALSLGVNYGYTYAYFDKYVASNAIDYAGNMSPMVPRHTFSIHTDYAIDFKNNIIDRMKINAQYAGLGKLYWHENNKVVQPFYGSLNGQVSFVRKNISLDLWAKNIGSEKYIAYCFSTDQGTFAQKGKPFTCGINVNFTF